MRRRILEPFPFSFFPIPSSSLSSPSLLPLFSLSSPSLLPLFSLSSPSLHPPFSSSCPDTLSFILIAQDLTEDLWFGWKLSLVKQGDYSVFCFDEQSRAPPPRKVAKTFTEFVESCCIGNKLQKLGIPSSSFFFTSSLLPLSSTFSEWNLLAGELRLSDRI